MPFFKLLICVLCLFVNAHLGFAQQSWSSKQLDSLQGILKKSRTKKQKTAALLEISKHYFEEGTKSLDSLYHYANKAIKVTESADDLAQQQTDARYYLAFHALETGQIAKAKALNGSVQTISAKLQYGLGLRNAAIISGFISEKENNINAASFYFESAYDIAKDYQLPKNVIFNTALALSSVYIRFNFPKEDIAAILDENKALVNTPNIPIKERAHFYVNQGDFYSTYTNDQDKAIENYTRSIALLTEHNTIKKLQDPLLKLSESYQKKGNLKKAIETLHKALNIATAAHQNEVYASIYYGLGMAYRNTKAYDKAVSHFEKAIQEHKNNNDAIGEADCLQQLGAIYLTRKNKQQATEIFDKSIGIYKQRIEELQQEDPLEPRMKHCYLELSKIYELKEDYKESSRYHILYRKFKNKVNNKTGILIPERLSHIKGVIAKNNEIETLKSENELRAIEAEKDKRVKAGLTAFLGVSALLIFLIFNRYRLKQKALKIIEHKNEEKKLLIREIHHRVKNNLQIILSLLGVQINNNSENEYLKTILTDSQNKIKSMAIIHQNLYNNDQFSKVKASSYIKELVANVQKSFSDDNNNIVYHFDLLEKDIEMSLAVPLGLIINELVTNVHKHAFVNKMDSNANTIKISFKPIENTAKKYKLIITDNGKGLPADFDAYNLTSYGLQLVNSLVSQLNGDIEINKDKGASLNITLEEPNT